MALKDKLAKNKELINRIIIGVVIGVLVTFIYAQRYAIYYAYLRLRTPKTNSAENNAIIKTLHPLFAYRVAKLVKSREEQGHTIILTSGFRSWEKQDELYQSGATTAPAGNSLHNYGMAVDLNEDGILKMATATSEWENSGIVTEGQNLGMRWGGYFNVTDRVHFDFMEKYDINLLKGLYENGQLIKNKYVKIW